MRDAFRTFSFSTLIVVSQLLLLEFQHPAFPCTDTNPCQDEQCQEGEQKVLRKRKTSVTTSQVVEREKHELISPSPTAVDSLDAVKSLSSTALLNREQIKELVVLLNFKNAWQLELKLFIRTVFETLTQMQKSAGNYSGNTHIPLPLRLPHSSVIGEPHFSEQTEVNSNHHSKRALEYLKLLCFTKDKSHHYLIKNKERVLLLQHLSMLHHSLAEECHLKNDFALSDEHFRAAVKYLKSALHLLNWDRSDDLDPELRKELRRKLAWIHGEIQSKKPYLKRDYFTSLEYWHAVLVETTNDSFSSPANSGQNLESASDRKTALFQIGDLHYQLITSSDKERSLIHASLSIQYFSEFLTLDHQFQSPPEATVRHSLALYKIGRCFALKTALGEDELLNASLTINALHKALESKDQEGRLFLSPRRQIVATLKIAQALSSSDDLLKKHEQNSFFFPYLYEALKLVDQMSDRSLSKRYRVLISSEIIQLLDQIEKDQLLDQNSLLYFQSYFEGLLKTNGSCFSHTRSEEFQIRIGYGLGYIQYHLAQSEPDPAFYLLKSAHTFTQTLIQNSNIQPELPEFESLQAHALNTLGLIYYRLARSGVSPQVHYSLARNRLLDSILLQDHQKKPYIHSEEKQESLNLIEIITDQLNR